MRAIRVNVYCSSTKTLLYNQYSFLHPRSSIFLIIYLLFHNQLTLSSIDPTKTIEAIKTPNFHFSHLFKFHLRDPTQLPLSYHLHVLNLSNYSSNLSF
ncbi:hypothetical protein QVD17_05457 [Tagetes erecta]|uniref:Uncharacterized protein n=1 Tax=Tagetes erecta TaxID=13708 RepID=A0AAD8PBJ1_TARER|nr:hypothetical protein QVD17_05457 [Tagetes erecta]